MAYTCQEIIVFKNSPSVRRGWVYSNLKVWRGKAKTTEDYLPLIHVTPKDRETILKKNMSVFYGPVSFDIVKMLAQKLIQTVFKTPDTKELALV